MSNGMGSNKELPLQGAILCCTSLSPEERSTIASMATQMGAIHKLDLTSDVTHLLVGDSNTPKYKYVARERPDVKVLRPEFVEAVRDVWMMGHELGDEDLKMLEQKWMWDVFRGLAICVTGWGDLQFRSELQNKISQNGGEYRGDLTKTVTHLVAKTPEGKKYQYATQWNIKVVSLKWLDESIERKMVLDEGLYHPTIPEAEQGVGAFKPKPQSPEPLTRKRSRDVIEPPVTVANPARKLRRTASQKLESQNDNLWMDIVGGGGFDSPGPQVDSRRGSMGPPASAKPTILEPQSFISDSTPKEEKSQQSVPKPIPEKPRGLLDGIRFYMHGFSSKEIPVLQNHLVSNDAEILSTSFKQFVEEIRPDQKSYLIVPYQLPQAQLPSRDGLSQYPTTVTHMWLEKCLYSRKIIPPEDHPTSTPFLKFPLPGFEKLIICSTGFTGIDLLHVSKSVNLLGAKYSEDFTLKASVLLCNGKEPHKEKLRHAFEWKVKVVSGDWLWDSLRSGEMKAFEKYLYPIPAQWKPPKAEEDKPAQSSERPGFDGRRDRNHRPPDAVAAKAKSFKAVKHEDFPTQPVIRKGSSNGAAPEQSVPLREIPNNSPPKKSEPNPPATAPTEKNDPVLAKRPIKAPVVPTTVASPVKKTSNTETANESDADARSLVLTDAITSYLQQQKEKQERRATRGNSKDPSFSSNNDAIVRDSDGRRTNRRRGLLGRSGSNNSAKSVLGAITNMSRASSIDTMNDEGLGSNVEDTTTTASQRSKHTSYRHDSFASNRSGTLGFGGSVPPLYAADSGTSNQISVEYDIGGGVGIGIPEELGGGRGGREGEEADDEKEEPVLTQLGYEDPDATALREKMMRMRGEFVEGDVVDSAKNKNAVDVGTMLVDGDVPGEVRRTRRVKTR